MSILHHKLLLLITSSPPHHQIVRLAINYYSVPWIINSHLNRRELVRFSGLVPISTIPNAASL